MFNDYHSVKGSKNTKNSLSLVHLKNQNSEKKKKKVGRLILLDNLESLFEEREREREKMMLSAATVDLW